MAKHVVKLVKVTGCTVATHKSSASINAVDVEGNDIAISTAPDVAYDLMEAALYATSIRPIQTGAKQRLRITDLSRFQVSSNPADDSVVLSTIVASGGYASWKMTRAGAAKLVETLQAALGTEGLVPPGVTRN